MEQLKGKVILIGKEPGQGRLLVAIAGGKMAAIGEAGSVPGCVSRCKPSEGMAHAKIIIDDHGVMILQNMKPQNASYVNGIEIASKRIALTDIVDLGKDHFRIPLSKVIETAKVLATPAVCTSESRVGIPLGRASVPAGQAKQPVKQFNIKHLERVWRDNHDSIRKIREKQKKVNLIRSGCGLFTACAMPCIFFLGPIGYVLTGVGVMGNLYSFIGLKNDNTADQQERLTEEFQDRYVCPNPDCNKFLGNMSYKLLKKQYSMHCPYCKCEYVEK